MYTPLAIALVFLVLWTRRVQQRLPSDPWVGRIPLLVGSALLLAMGASAADLVAMAQQRPPTALGRIAPWLAGFAEAAGFVGIFVYSLRPAEADRSAP